ncbi:ricin-type beta-trefoil lectin domain protein [Actinacidiphila glaucinigra]|uniref:ricin-type beta-trefoil lectin domain protein n=1 Tax=Actinacidiphila glaucinigra TaxID=235986 RepID=UPI0033C69B48
MAGLLVGLLPAQAMAAPPPGGGDRSGVNLIDLPEEEKAPDADTGVLDDLSGEATVAPEPYEPPEPVVPAGDPEPIDLTNPVAGDLVKADNLPVLLGAPENATPEETAGVAGTWQVGVAADPASAAEVNGVLLTVTPPASADDATVDVALDYSDFEKLYSADWADRMEFVAYPECFLSAPDDEACNQAIPLVTQNDDNTGQIKATVDVAAATAASSAARTASLTADRHGSADSAVYHPNKNSTLQALLPRAASGAGSVVLAATDGGSGAKGDYTATPLASAGTWSAGGSSGAFTWSQAVQVPPTPAGPAPSIAFGYNSQVVDGRTSATNNQASWIGDGWDYNPGSIERTYRNCRDDTDGDANNASHKTSDLCWGSYNAVLSLGGSTTELVVDARTCPGYPEKPSLDDPSCDWITANGDGSRVEKLKDTDTANGDKDGEYWKVTTRDGTQYYFGKNKLPGWTTGKETTDSVFTVPVAGNHSGEPCHDSSFTSSFCDQGWRWNLDYVVDVNGNAMSLWWNKETNYYAKNEKYTSPVSYTRGGYLSRIDYGQRSNTLFTANPVARVQFTVGERCFDEAETGLTCNEAAFQSRDYGKYRLWYDTPVNLYCAGTAGKRCPVPSPTFWSRKRLSSVTTSAQRQQGSTTLSNVDKYVLKQSFPRTLTDTAPPLWLESIQRTGYTVGGDTLPMNAVEFSHNNQAMPNRVTTGTADPRPAFDRLRIRRVVTEYGGEIDVDYSSPCPAMATSAHPKPENNGTRCYPVYWSPDPDQETIDWFNKYVVTSITQKPRFDGVPDMVTEYQYPDDGAAWAKNQAEFSKKTTRTYDQWRGYAQVTVLTGKNDSTMGIVRGKSVTRYFRGMDGDPLPGGGTRSVMVKDSTGADIAKDLPAFQGMTAESLTYTQANNDGSGGTVASRTVTTPSAHLLATRARDDSPDLHAYRTQTDQTETVTPASGTNPNDSRTSRTVKVTTQYDDTYGLPTQVESLGDTGKPGDETCTITSYLHNTTAWLIGMVEQTKTTAGTCDKAATATGDDVISASRTYYDYQAYHAPPTKGLPTEVWGTDGAGTGWIRTSKTHYDDYGRVDSVTDANDQTGTTTYNPSTGQVYSTTAENALHYTSTTTVEPGRGTPLDVSDVNGRTTHYAYDALGRTTDVWTPSQKTTDPADTKFTYDTTVGKPVAVTTETLRDNGTYARSVAIYDGLGRARQTQADAVGGGRIVTDTYYNANGTVRRTNNGYYAEGAPSTSPFELKSDYNVRSATITSYDGLGRPVTVTPIEGGNPQDGTIPLGGTVKTANKVTRYTYDWDATTIVPPTGAAASRSFVDALGRTTEIDHFTDALRAAHISTTYKYDTRGNRTEAKDTKDNIWSWEYDARGRVTKAVDPDTGLTQTWYDKLDRPETTLNARGVKVWTKYDPLGRTLEQRQDDASGNLLTAFTYDSVLNAKGQLAKATRYNDGVAITTEITGYDAEYRPTAKSITIPDSITDTYTDGLARTYNYAYAYTKTGLLQSVTVPAVGGLAQEKVITRYNADDLPVSTSGLDWYTADTTYSPYGEVMRTTTGEMPNRVWTTNLFDENTGQLNRAITDREDIGSPRVNDRTYTYDAAGNVTQLKDTDGSAYTDRQCFTYDALGQLHQAWTSANQDCKAPGQTLAAPVYNDASGTVTATNVTAANDGYWQTYTYDDLGNRKQLVEHNPTVTVTAGHVDTSGDTTTAYDYGTKDTAGTLRQPHTLTSISTDTATVDTLAQLTYDATGNTHTRTYGGDTQTIDWTWDGKAKTVSGFGANGNGQLLGLAGKCLDLQSASTTAGTPLQLYSCNGSKAQNFKLDTASSTLTILGKCLTPTGGATADNTPVTLAACNGASSQKWTLTAGTLKHVSSSKCLTVPGTGSADGTDLQIAPCTTSGAQKWSFADQTTYLYDASGNRIITATAGSHTLSLDDFELSTDAAGTTAYCQRYYGQAGAPTVMRHSTRGSTTTILTAMVTDHHGTAIGTVGLDNTQAIERQRTDPFGVQRGTQTATWRSHRGYLGGTDDNTTGLTHLGAREYDTDTGRFISADPVLDIARPLSLNGYAYSANNPVTLSDPSGLDYGCGGGACAYMNDGSSARLEDEDKHEGRQAGSSGGLDNVAIVTKTVTVTKPADCDWKCKIKGWAQDHRDVVSFGTEIIVGGGCALGAAATGVATGGVGLGLAAGCGALAKMSGAVVDNYLDSGADHSNAAVLQTEGIAAVQGAAEAVVGYGAGKIMEKGATALAGKLFAKACSKNSFPAGTLVLSADGTTKPIEDIELGDEVVATDPETGETDTQAVAATILTPDDVDFTTITLSSGKSEADETLTATDHHPMWSPSEHAWIEAGNLTDGMTLRTDKGHDLRIVSIKHFRHLQAAYNLTVADLHTYYVLAGATPVLVHNCDGVVHWLNENAHMSAKARAYDSGATGSRSGVAPALQYYKVGGKRLSHVKFDGIDEANRVMIDRKWAVTTYNKTYRQAMNQSLALEQNGYTGRWEVPNAAEAARARKVLGNLMITNIRVRVVP